jgi:hypothetical protein
MSDIIPTYNFTWQQGEDGVIGLVYQVNGVPVDLTGYNVRMDVASAGTVLYVFNSSDISGTPLDVTGSADNEATLGSDGSITIVVPRAVSLTGPLSTYLNQELDYDIFLRDPSNKQKKILEGTITLEASITKWT